MTTWFCSDLHFMHKNIVSFTDRKLVASQDNHTEWLIDIWNSTVNNADKVFHLGDFSFSHKYDVIASLVKKLKGQKFFIKGNHDRSEILDRLKEDHLIQDWYHYKEIKIGGIVTCLFHSPITSWNQQGRGSLHLHGHSHGSLKESKGKILDVGIDMAFNIYGEHKFFSEEDVLEFMQQKSTEVQDHHKVI